jgi:hypothetical protein
LLIIAHLNLLTVEYEQSNVTIRSRVPLPTADLPAIPRSLVVVRQ